MKASTNWISPFKSKFTPQRHICFTRSVQAGLGVAGAEETNKSRWLLTREQFGGVGFLAIARELKLAFVSKLYLAWQARSGHKFMTGNDKWRN